LTFRKYHKSFAQICKDNTANVANLVLLFEYWETFSIMQSIVDMGFYFHGSLFAILELI